MNVHSHTRIAKRASSPPGLMTLNGRLVGVRSPPRSFPRKWGTQFLRQSLGPRIRGDERCLMIRFDAHFLFGHFLERLLGLVGGMIAGGRAAIGGGLHDDFL